MPSYDTIFGVAFKEISGMNFNILFWVFECIANFIQKGVDTVAFATGAFADEINLDRIDLFDHGLDDLDRSLISSKNFTFTGLEFYHSLAI